MSARSECVGAIASSSTISRNLNQCPYQSLVRISAPKVSQALALSGTYDTGWVCAVPGFNEESVRPLGWYTAGQVRQYFSHGTDAGQSRLTIGYRSQPSDLWHSHCYPQMGIAMLGAFHRILSIYESTCSVAFCAPGGSDSTSSLCAGWLRYAGVKRPSSDSGFCGPEGCQDVCIAVFDAVVSWLSAVVRRKVDQFSATFRMVNVLARRNSFRGNV